MPPRGSLTREDEAKFALLEPDGVSPLKSARSRQTAASVSQFKGGLVLTFALIFVLYLVYPRPSTNNAFVAAAADQVNADRRSGGVVSSSTSSKNVADSGDLGDTVVVGQEPKPTSSTALDGGESVFTQPAVIQPSADGDGPVVIRHAAGGDENIEYSPPPPPPPAPSAGAFSFFSWLRGRRVNPTRGRVAELIAKLKKEIADGISFEAGEMGQRLAEIERLERAESDSVQKRANAAEVKVLESTVKAAAASRHDVVSEKIASVEMLMSKYGPKHPDLIPKLRSLESDLAHPDMAHANQDSRLEQVRPAHALTPWHCSGRDARGARVSPRAHTVPAPRHCASCARLSAHRSLAPRPRGASCAPLSLCVCGARLCVCVVHRCARCARGCRR